MSRTFEERVSVELDSLYRGALFLAGGDTSSAEGLLVAAMKAAFHGHASRDASVPFDVWLENRLVGYFVESLPTGEAVKSAAPNADVPEHVLRSIGADAVFGAAAVVPGRARAALWLVLLRRRSYAEVAQVLGVDREAMGGLLAHRARWITEMATRADGRSDSARYEA